MAPLDAQDSIMSDESDDEPQIWRSGDGQAERVHKTPYSLVGPMHHKQPGRHEVVYRPPVYQIDAVEWTGKGTVNGAEPLARNLPAVHIGFTREQKKTLKEQIMASKTLKKSIEQSTFMPSDWEKVKPMPLPGAISAEKDMSLMFERWMQAFGLHGATPADKAMMAAWQQPSQLQDADKRKQNTALVQRKQKQLEKTKKEEASKAAEAERAAKQAQLEREAQQRRQIIEAHPAVQRLWPHALYHLDYELRSNPQAVDFQLNSSLPKMLANERNRLLEKSRNEWASRIMSQLQDNDGSRTASGDMRTARTRLLVQQRKLKLLGMQRQLRQKVERRQQVINQMPERIYKKFQNEVKKYLSAAEREAQDKYCALWGNRLAGVRHVRGEIYTKLANWKDVRLVMNRAVVKQHERLLRQNKPETAMDNREARMQALKANDFAAYQAMLKATQGDAAALDDRYAAITSFLAETENYLNTLTETIMEKKLHETKEKAFSAALADARAAGVPEEAAEQQAIQAANEAAEKSEFARMNENLAGDAQARYVALAHAVEEDVKQPRMLRGPGGARLREYQHVGLKWMVSLYNNNLNGILADEMGLGKTVQVMALIAHLMEEKGNFGPHLIVVPNAVLVNWRAEMTTWLPDCKVVYYHGDKTLRNQMWKEQVESITFNVLVTTYEFIMYDAKQLSKMQWKYLIIDEAQRMKDRDSKLSKAFDKFSFEKRLLLTGTPLQNELRELWSLLNLLLPQLFNDQQQFAKWFGDALTKNSKGDSEEDLIDNERRVVVVNRRQVQDVEGKLPEKVTITIKCPMTGYQGAIYDWVRATSLLRINPSSPDAVRRGTNIISVRNRVMEQRKICNHPLITYPPDGYEASMLKHWYEADDRLVAQCGKMLFVDRLLVKFFKTGHRVLLFSTMTKVLDIMERYLMWRTLGEKMQYRRIDGTTALEDREKAIHDFNRKGSDVYVFLLSIRAAGRGLNLQTADTVIMYDPDANPKNEEQAVARSHRIGQTKPVRVIHLEAVADATPDATPAEDGDYEGDAEGDAARAAAANAAAVANRRGIGAVAAAATDVRRNTTKYADSVESVYRHVIQKQKNDMAAEIIDAGRFDRKTTDAERKSTLEQIVADAERNKIAKNEVPTWDWIHRKLARSPAELEEFNRIEEEMEWIEPWTLEKSPEWIRFTAEDVKAAVPERKRRRGELEIPSMTGWGAVKDTYDESGRRVRKARVKAADKIAAHAEWVTHNPYRMPQPGEAAPEHDNDSAATADEEQNGTNGAQPSNVTEGEGGSACPSTSVAGAAGRSTGTAEDDDEAVAFSDDDMEEQDDGDNFD